MLALTLVLPGLVEIVVVIEGRGIPAFPIVCQVFHLQGVWHMASIERSSQLRGAGTFPDPHLADLGTADQLGVPIRDEA